MASLEAVSNATGALAQWMGAFSRHGDIPRNGWLDAGRCVGHALARDTGFTEIATGFVVGTPASALCAVERLRVDTRGQDFLVDALDIPSESPRLPLGLTTKFDSPEPIGWSAFFGGVPGGVRNPIVARQRLDGVGVDSPLLKKRVILDWFTSIGLSLDPYLFRGMFRSRMSALLAGGLEKPETAGIFAYGGVDLCATFGLTQDVDPFDLDFFVVFHAERFFRGLAGQDDYWHWVPTRYPVSPQDAKSVVAMIINLRSGDVYPSIEALRSEL